VLGGWSRHHQEPTGRSVARSVRIVSAPWCVICSGSGSADSRGPNGGTYRHSRGYAAIVASPIIGSPVNTAAIDTTAIDTTVINTNTPSIIRGGVI